MMKSLRIHEAARREANEITAWYADRSNEIAVRFSCELLTAMRSSAIAPSRYPEYLHGARRILLRKFPYFVVFSIGRMRCTS